MKKERERISRRTIFIHTAITVGVFAFCTGVSYLLDFLGLANLNFIMIYILGALVVAIFSDGYIYSTVFAIVSMFSFNFCFTAPRYSLAVFDTKYIITFVLMLVISFTISTVTYQLKMRAVSINALNEEKIKIRVEAEKEKMRSTLLRSISHDLRTPLTTISNGAELLLTHADFSREEEDSVLSSIKDKSLWTIRLVENLLSLTRLDSKDFAIKKEPEAVEEILPQAVRNISGIAGNRQIHYDIPKELFIVPMDATLIVQAITNLLNNAVRFTEDRGNIWIQVFNSGTDAVFRIRNDGEKFAVENLPHLFELYYTTADSNSSGTGIGLAICRAIISAHKGKIDAYNTDSGVMFEFTLPMEKN